MSFFSDGRPSQLGRRAGRDDRASRRSGVSAPTSSVNGRFDEVDLGHVAEHERRPEPRRLLAEDLHHLRAEDAVGEARIVLDVGGDGELAARLRALDDDGREVRAGGVDGRREAGRAGAEDEHAMRRGLPWRRGYKNGSPLGQPRLVAPRIVV